MPGFSESNIILDFPDSNYFRFADCPGYIQLKGFSFKEMDACWYESGSNTYWFIELKDFSFANLEEPITVSARVWDIVKKAVDSLCMFLSSKHSYPYSSSLLPCYTQIPDDSTQLKIITIIHCTASQRGEVQNMHDLFKIRFKPYADLFRISSYAILEHQAACRILPNGMVK